MEADELRQLKRNPDIFKTYFSASKDNVITKENISVMFPSRYINKQVAALGNTVNVLAIYAILDDYNNYCVVNTPIIQTLAPAVIADTNIDGIDYKILYFNKNDIFLTTNTLIVRDSVIHPVVEEFFLQGKIPWFLNYNDLASMFIESKKYTGNGVGLDPLPFELLTSIVSRNPDDKKEYYRTCSSKHSVPYYIGLNNPFYSFNNTGAKLIGNRFGTGLNTAIIEKERETALTTSILRR